MRFCFRASVARSLRLAFALSTLSTLVAACSDARPPAAAATSGVDQLDGSVADGGVSDGTAPDGATNPDGGTADGGGGAACNMVLAEGPLVAQTSTAAAQPTPAGGHIYVGTYWLTERTKYGGLSPDSLFVTRALVIDATTLDAIGGIAMSAGAAPTLSTTASTYQITDTNVLSTKESCPGPPHVTNVNFTAGGPELTLFPDSDTSELYVLQ